MYFSNKEYINTFHIQPQIISSISFMSRRKCSYILSPVILWGNLSNQSETGNITIRCTHVYSISHQWKQKQIATMKCVMVNYSIRPKYKKGINIK